MHRLILITSLIVCSTFAQVSAADVFVALNKSNSATITEESLLKILKAEQLVWENGNSVFLMIDSLETTSSQDFDEVLNMSKSQFMEFWRIKFFSGRALIPKQIKNESNALTILSENKNGIYVSIGKSIRNEISSNPDLKVINLKY